MSEISKVQKLIRERGLDAYIVPRSDAYQNEQVMDCDERLQWLMGFSGSAGFAVVTKNSSALFVDGRYTEQVKHEITDKKIKILDFSSSALSDFLAGSLADGFRLAVCGDMITHSGQLMSREGIEKSILQSRCDIGLEIIDECLVDMAWGKARPSPSYGEGWLIDRDKFGNIEDRVGRVKKRLGATEQEVAILVSRADSVCWLLGVRGWDIDMMPVVLSRAILFIDDDWKIVWYVEGDRAEIMQSLIDKVSLKVEVKNAESLAQDIKHIENLQIDEKAASESLIVAYDGDYTSSTCLVRMAQSVKSRDEISGFRDCHILDGNAMIRLLAWIDGEGVKSEGDIVRRIESLRRDRREYICPSFFSIVGISEKGAIIHYRGDADSDMEFKSGELLLIDCGGHYIDGTTDISRTVVCGRGSESLRIDYTKVLRSHIMLLRQRFPLGTTGSQLDAIARGCLWNYDYDYAHGTGHGVGHILGVHESPPSISRGAIGVEIEEGMVLSIEPGMYRVGEYGIRIENLVVVEREGDWLYFDSLTCVPYAMKLIEIKLLRDGEIEWLDNYHAWVYQQHYRDLVGEDREWLVRETSKLGS